MDRGTTSKDKSINFIKKPISISHNYRPLYKIAEIVLILKLSCTKETSTLLKLHFMSWAISCQQNMDNVIDYIINDKVCSSEIFRLDPALNRALDIAIAEELIQLDDHGRYALLRKGYTFAQNISKSNDIMIKEKNFLKLIGKKITDKRIVKYYG